MNDANKNIRSEEVEEALKILEANGEELMDAYLIPRGMNWMELESRLLKKEAQSLENCFFNLRHGIQFDPNSIQQLPSFRSAIFCAVGSLNLLTRLRIFFKRISAFFSTRRKRND